MPCPAKTRRLTDCFSGRLPQAIAHIRCLFSVLVDPGPLTSSDNSPDSIISFAFRVRSVTPPPAAAARLDHVPVTSPELPPPETSAPASAPVAPARADRPFRGIALILLSTIFLGTSDVTAKYLSSTLPSIEIAWLRFLVFGLIMMPAMAPGSPLYAMRTTRPGFQLLRGVALLGSSLFFITGLRFLPIAEASATGFVAPLFLTALAPLVWVSPGWHGVLFGILIGVASTAGQWIVVLAFRYADASVLAPFSYTQLLWVSVLGFLIFGEVPNVYTVVGAGFIVASGLYTAHRERVRRSQLLTVPGEP